MESFQSSPMTCQEGRIRHGGDVRPARVLHAASLMREYDIVHQHAFTPAVAMASIVSGSNVVYTVHGNFGFGRKSRFSDRINARLRKFFLNRFVKHVTFNSNFTRKVAESRNGLARVARSVVYNGISLANKTECHTTGKRDDLTERLTGRFVVGTTSRFVGFKRVDRLIRAFAEFCRGKSATLLLVGDGPLRSDYETLVDELGLRDVVVFTGFRQDVADLQQQMDVCVFPSETEPFGLVAVETLSLGKPTIVLNDGGGITEIIERHNTSDIVDGIDGLVCRLNEYYENRSRIEVNAAARKSVARSFDIVRMAEEMCRVYESVLGGATFTDRMR
jgi:glycosyltransferase involved in cell wall biosynthesis